MITDNDIKKLRTVFTTKEDLKQLSDRFETKFVTKEDLKQLSDKFETRFATKEDFQESTNQLVELITAGFDRIDKAIEKLDEHADIINNHEHRLDRLEDKVLY